MRSPSTDPKKSQTGQMPSPPRLAAIKEPPFWDSPAEDIENDDCRSPGRSGHHRTKERVPQSVPPKPTVSSLSGSPQPSKNSKFSDGKPSPLSPSRRGNSGIVSTAQKRGASSPDVFGRNILFSGGAERTSGSVTPTILYGQTKECREAAPGPQNNHYYSLKSPHWHGEVMVGCRIWFYSIQVRGYPQLVRARNFSRSTHSPRSPRATFILRVNPPTNCCPRPSGPAIPIAVLPS